MLKYIEYRNIINKYKFRRDFRDCFYQLLCFLFILLISFSFFSSCIFSQPSQTLKDPSRLSYPSINFTPNKPERHVLSNGIILYLLEDHEIPLITVNMLIRTGAIYEPADKTGLAQITGNVMRTGGTEFLSPDELDKKLEYMAAIIETDIGLESGSADLSVLKKDFDEALKIFSDIIRCPAFSAEKVELEKMKVIESIRRQNDEPFTIASREFKSKVYSGDPRGRRKTIRDVEQIKRQDIIQFYNKFYFPDNIIMGISGDFSKEDMINTISEKFGDWDKKTESPVPPAPIPSESSMRAVIYAPKPLPQSTIIIGHLCCPKNNPDFFTMEVLNFILGGGSFNSRLIKEIRSNQGLAYSVGSFYRGAIDYGVFGAYAITKAETTGKVIDLVLEEINRLIKEGIAPEELTWAKDSIINQFIFSFANTASLVKRYMSLEYDNLPEDFLETYTDNISKITLEDVQKIAKRYLKPEKSSIIIVGDAKGFDCPLEKYGIVDKADMNIY